MEAFTIMVVLQVIVFSQAKLYISQESRPCSWTVSSPGQNRSVAIFGKAALHPLATAVCEALGCGEVYKMDHSPGQPNTSCLTGCTYHNYELINCNHTARGECWILSQVVCAAPYVTPTSDPCVWKLRSPDSDQSAITLTEESMRTLPSEICGSVGCGEAFLQQQTLGTRASRNSACLADCVYDDFHLRNCSVVRRSGCYHLSKIVCGNHVVRLAGGSHHCAGRVELWQAGRWGTVCDDMWDKQDADVVCAQLGCGYALSVTGQGGPYSLGRGTIYLDDLNCTGSERSLWECPAVIDEHDCGHKEDAGVVCSEYKALRLTGGLDRCSGRVEIHRNGSWGTVCDNCWYTQEASMVCAMLGCGGVKEFEKSFVHKHGTLWYYICQKNHTSLWQCKELVNIPHICQDTEAAGVICENSLGLPMPTTSNPNTLITTTGPVAAVGPKWVWSLELLICVGLSTVLLIALITNVILCCLIRKGRTAQQQYSNLQASVQAEENNYRDSIHLVKVTSNNGEPSAQPVPPQMWTQSSVESGSCDTDYEPSDSGPDTGFPLSTFRNSMRYSADGRVPSVKGTQLQSVTEEGMPLHTTVAGYAQDQSEQHTPTAAFQGLTAACSVDSFESSSTSSGEWYENTGHDAADPNTEMYENTEENRSPLHTMPCPVPTSQDTEEILDQTGNTYQAHSNGVLSNHNQGALARPCGGDDSPIYSPVTRESQLYTDDSDYDDIASYLQVPDQ